MKQKIVKKGYNKIAEEYSVQRDEFKNISFLEKFEKLLSKSSLILDIGCGAGVPIDRYFVEQGHSIVGIDISEKQIELAKKNVPQGKYEVKDMSELKAGEYQVDAIISFYAIFHIPRESHQELFVKLNSFLPSGGLILATMGSSEWEGEEDFHGVDMYWSHFGAEKNKKIIERAGFEIIFDEIDTSGGEKHQIIIAKKV
ncbi:MAG: class I SAM-dependent methyltransferase [Candidatus Pacebacteria bacterium]|nr:class I SAM-dependent methyltransferase [Candidatus Paceibacterota bacterium]